MRQLQQRNLVRKKIMFVVPLTNKNISLVAKTLQKVSQNASQTLMIAMRGFLPTLNSRGAEIDEMVVTESPGPRGVPGIKGERGENELKVKRGPH